MVVTYLQVFITQLPLSCPLQMSSSIFKIDLVGRGRKSIPSKAAETCKTLLQFQEYYLHKTYKLNVYHFIVIHLSEVKLILPEMYNSYLIFRNLFNVLYYR